MTAAVRLPFVTAGLPGSGGTLKETPEDFRVDEIPAYPPSGEGPHLWLQVEKRGRTTRDVVREAARLLGVQERDVGVAGLKDRHAVTVQWLSFPVAGSPDATSIGGDGWRVLAASRHGNKLRTGHSRGNRFSIVVRGGDLSAARAAAEALSARGLPNFFGAQRFGADGTNADLGRAILRGANDAEVRRASRDRFLRRLALSAWQSLLFNRWLAERMADGLFARALAGDAMKKLDSGGLFTCDDPAADQPRVDRFEISRPAPCSAARSASPAARRGSARRGSSRPTASPRRTWPGAAARPRERAARRASR